VSKSGVADKVEIISGDFFNDSFPKADIITMGNILHDWGTTEKKMLKVMILQQLILRNGPEMPDLLKYLI